jgi:hypothetical protein
MSEQHRAHVMRHNAGSRKPVSENVARDIRASSPDVLDPSYDAPEPPVTLEKPEQALIAGRLDPKLAHEVSARLSIGAQIPTDTLKKIAEACKS